MRKRPERLRGDLAVYRDDAVVLARRAGRLAWRVGTSGPLIRRTLDRGTRKMIVVIRHYISALGWIVLGFYATRGEQHQGMAEAYRFLIFIGVVAFYAWRTRVSWHRITPPAPRKYADAQPRRGAEYAKVHTPAPVAPAPAARKRGGAHNAVRRQGAAARRQAEAAMIAASRAD